MGYIEKTETVLKYSKENYTQNKSIEEIILECFAADTLNNTADYTDTASALITTLSTRIENEEETQPTIEYNPNHLVTILADILISNDLYNNGGKFKEKGVYNTLCHRDIYDAMVEEGVLEDTFNIINMATSTAEESDYGSLSTIAKQIIDNFYNSIDIDYSSIQDNIILFLNTQTPPLNESKLYFMPKQFMKFCEENPLEGTKGTYMNFFTEEEDIDSTPENILKLLCIYAIRGTILNTEKEPTQEELLTYLYNSDKLTSGNYTLKVEGTQEDKKAYSRSMSRYIDLFKHIKIDKQAECNNRICSDILKIFCSDIINTNEE